MRNIKMILEYDGIRYHGWQRQGDTITIQKVLEESISKITQENIRIIGSGRTDAGVHAINQVANFRTNSNIGVRNLFNGINSLLPWDIVVKVFISDIQQPGTLSLIQKLRLVQTRTPRYGNDEGSGSTS